MKREHFIEVRVPGKCWIFRCKRRQGFLFDMYAWYLMYSEYGTELADIGKSTPDALIGRMIYTAAVSACKDAGKRVWFTKDDVTGWIDAMPNKDVKKLGAVFAESMKVMSKVSEDSQKKTGK